MKLFYMLNSNGHDISTLNGILSDKNNFFHDLKHAHVVFILVMNLHFNTHEQDKCHAWLLRA